MSEEKNKAKGSHNIIVDPQTERHEILPATEDFKKGKVSALELPGWGAQNTIFKRDKLSKGMGTFSHPRLRYWKFTNPENMKVYAWYSLDEMPKHARELGGVYISLDEFLRIKLLPEEYEALKQMKTDIRRMKMIKELEMIRLDSEIEKKLLK